MGNIVSFQNAINKAASTGQCVVVECLDYDGIKDSLDLRGYRIERRGQTLFYIYKR